MIIKIENHAEWIEARKNGIGGSDAGTVLGLNHYKSNVDLYREKAQIITPPDISDKPAIIYGKTAEEHIREIFRLDYSGYNLEYHQYWLYQHEKNKFMYATLDGELTERETGRRGILEIKTATIQNASQWREWDEDKIPPSYYAQNVHQLSCTGWDFVILRAYIRYYKNGRLRAIVRDYKLNREDAENDIKYLENKETQFWAAVEARQEPPLILPDI